MIANTFFLSSPAYLKRDAVSLNARLSQICQEHKDKAREEFITKTKESNEKRLSLAQSSPIGPSL